MTPPALGVRQVPACEQCRRRKLRCDSKKPKCSNCEHAESECDINTQRIPRGPKKGYLAALQSKIAMLESRLQAQEQGQINWPESGSLDGGPMTQFPTFAGPPLPPTPVSDLDSFIAMPDIGLTASETNPFLSSFFDSGSVSPAAMQLPSKHASPPSATRPNVGGVDMTDVMQAELDQTYFDRMHAAVPILHHRRYLSWSKLPVKSRSRVCLQYAVWATASLLSAHFHHLQDALYTELKRLLVGTSFLPSTGGQGLEVDVELAQAWVLAATYEFIKTYHHEACLSAGRTFRLVQLMGLHEVDRDSGIVPSIKPDEVDFIVTEEKRRVFWMSFTLEALCSIRNKLPLVVNESVNGQRMPTSTLNDSIAKGSQTFKSPFNECILIAATCSRAWSHLQQSNKRKSDEYTHTGGHRLEWEQWLDDVLSVRLQTLAQEYPNPADSSDPMLLFANFLAQASMVYLWRQIRDMDLLSDENSGRSSRGGHMSLAARYQQRAYGAVKHTVALSRLLTDFPLCKIHPFTPIPLFLSIEFLIFDDLHSVDSSLLHSLFDIIRQLVNVDSTQQSYQELLVDPESVVRCSRLKKDASYQDSPISESSGGISA